MEVLKGKKLLSDEITDLWPVSILELPTFTKLSSISHDLFHTRKEKSKLYSKANKCLLAASNASFLTKPFPFSTSKLPPKFAKAFKNVCAIPDFKLTIWEGGPDKTPLIPISLITLEVWPPTLRSLPKASSLYSLTIFSMLPLASFISCATFKTSE